MWENAKIIVKIKYDFKLICELKLACNKYFYYDY